MKALEYEAKQLAIEDCLSELKRTEGLSVDESIKIIRRLSNK